MNIFIHATQPTGERSMQRDWVIARVRQSTQRMSSWLERVTVRLIDVNGPKGGVDQQCHIQLRTIQGNTLVVRAIGDSWQSSLEDALDRMRMALRRFQDQRKNASRLRRRVASGHQVAGDASSDSNSL